MSVPSKKVMDQRFAEKMKARAEGRTPVFVAEPPQVAAPRSEVAMREKLQKHFAAVASSKKPKPIKKEPAPESQPTGLEAEIVALKTKAEITARLKADFGLEIDKDSKSREELIAMYLEEAGKKKD